MSHTTRPTQRIRLWDLPTRLFHWLLLLSVGTAIATALLGGQWMTLHGQAGACTGGLLVFRLVWGFAGNRYARFASFMPSRASLHSYMRGTWRGFGHNPLGACSVLALLLVLSLQVITGLFSNDEIAFAGPWAERVSDAVSMWLTHWHHLLSNLLYVLLALHIFAIFFYYALRRDNLLGPMLTGFKAIAQAQAAPDDRPGRWPGLLLAVALALACTLLFGGLA